MSVQTDPVAPSAALASGIATPPTPSAPSANGAPNIVPLTEAAMAQAASLSLQALAAEPPTPVPPAALESPAASAGSPADPAGQPPPPPDPTAAGADDAEPSAEVLASLSESGRRALQAEREKRKEARTKLAEALAEIERLKANNPPASVAQAPLNGDPAATPPVQPPAPAPRAVPTELAACQTFEAVDACAMQAAQREALAMKLNAVLVTAGVEAVVQELRANGVENFRGIPVDELTGEQLAGQLSSTFQESRLVQLQAEQQKQRIADQGRAFAEAIQLVPELKDPKSARGQQFAAILNANPRVRELGTRWPVLVAQQLLGIEAARTRTTTTPSAVPAPPVLASAPGAPRTSAAHVPQPTELDALRERVMTGRATEADMNRFAALQVRTG